MPHRWLLKRNCSITPRQLLGVYLGLAAVSLLIALGFWQLGATLVLPFAGIELAGVGAAMLVYARHAADREQVVVSEGRVRVECTFAGHTEAAEFSPARVRIEPSPGDRSLIEISGEGRRIRVGRFVRPERRAAFAASLRAALAPARGDFRSHALAASEP